MQRHITNLCSTEFEPIVRPEISVVDIDNNKIVVVEINALNLRNKPCYYKPKGLHNGSYIRVGDRDDHMTEYEIYKCISYRENAKDDLKAVTRATIKDLDANLLNKFIVNAKIDKPKFAEFSDEEILLQYGVLTQVEDKIFPTVAGLMVLGIYPQRFFPQWFVAAIVIPGFEVSNLGEIGQRFDDNKRIEEYHKKIGPHLKVIDFDELLETLEITIDDIKDINQVEMYIGCDVLADKSDTPPLEEGEFYIDDMVGLEAYDENEKLLGKVVDVILIPYNDLLEIELLDGKKVLIPYVDEYILEITEDKIVVRLLEVDHD